MININDNLVPFEGLSTIMLYQSDKIIKKELSDSRIIYEREIWDNEECTVPMPWEILHINNNSINLFFANSKLFKIVVENEYAGKLPNGICLGMTMQDAVSLDDQLTYDEWNEEYGSPLGYWVEDDPETSRIISISIFIREIDDDDFEEYKW